MTASTQRLKTEGNSSQKEATPELPEEPNDGVGWYTQALKLIPENTRAIKARSAHLGEGPGTGKTCELLISIKSEMSKNQMSMQKLWEDDPRDFS